MKERLETIITKYEDLKQELTKPEVLADYNKLRTLSKEQKDKAEYVLLFFCLNFNSCSPVLLPSPSVIF